MRRPLRIAAFAQNSPLFINVLMGLRKGFLALGADIHVGWPLMDARSMATFVGNFKPDVILEINRTKFIIDKNNRDIKYISWIHDFQYNAERINIHDVDSDIIYFIMPPDIYGADSAVAGRWKYLWPGADPEFFHPRPTTKICDLSLVGHMYAPPPPELRRARLRAGGVSLGDFAALETAFLASPLTQRNASIDQIHDFLRRYGASLGGPEPLGDLDPRMLFLVDEYLLRTKTRKNTAEAMLRASQDVRFHGNAGWALWPEFARRYAGEILDPEHMAAVYRSSRLNVHDTPWPLHFRPLECMAAGGVVMIPEGSHGEARTEFARWFAPGVHFISYPDDGLEVAARAALADESALGRMGLAAAEVVRRAHGWECRARQIIGDVAEL